ncbi:MAG: hypothetical protein HWE30_13855 [Methylocystaceae bacterium]|nr:hypothetical protein [Methylocystaceae bacterium]
MIRVHILEDTDEKFDKIQDFITSSHIKDTITITRSVDATDCRNFLSKHEADVLLLDIIIPHLKDAEPQASTGFMFLDEIQEAEYLNKPKYIVAITAFEEAEEEFNDLYGNDVWSVLRVNDLDSKWQDGLLRLFSHINSANKDAFNDSIDVLWVCALMQPELSEVLNLNWNWQKITKFGRSYNLYAGKFIDKSGTERTCWAVPAQRMGMVSTAVMTQYLISKVQPKAIVMSGICAALPGEADLDDVIVSDCCWNYESGKWKNGQFEYSPHQISIESSSSAMLSDFILHHFPNEGNKHDFNVKAGPTASGSAVVADSKRAQELIKTQNRKVLGLEMEIYGLYEAASATTRYAPFFLAAKGVCDFADEKKGDDHQLSASKSSVTFMNEFLTEKFPEIHSHFTVT